MTIEPNQNGQIKDNIVEIRRDVSEMKGSLSGSVDSLAQAVRALTVSIEQQTARMESHMSVYKKSVPIGVVFMILMLVGGIFLGKEWLQIYKLKEFGLPLP